MLYDFLSNYTKSNVYPFHMPGHKRNRAFLPDDLPRFDITEIPGSDNLRSPSGILSDFRSFISETFKADESFLLLNGSTAGVLASIIYASHIQKNNNEIILHRQSHVSAYNGVLLANMHPVFIDAEPTDYGFFGSISPENIKTALKNHPNAAAVFITSPTYEGITSDIDKIVNLAHNEGKIVIVDEAHGSHFSFSDYFPESAVFCGADIVIHGLHKTLPVMGQVSAVHINSSSIDLDQFGRIVSALQTSSPSYTLMAQADFSLRRLSSEPFWFENYVEMLNVLRKDLSELKRIKLLDKQSGMFDIDKSKLVFTLENLPIVGKEFEELLREKYSVQVEMSGYNHIIALTSPADTKEGFNRFIDALNEIDSDNRLNFSQKFEMRHNDKGYSVTYPPGVPICINGDFTNYNFL